MMSDWMVTSRPVVGSSRIRSDGYTQHLLSASQLVEAA